MGIAAHGYHDAKKHLPRHGGHRGPPFQVGGVVTIPRTGLSSQALLLPYMEDKAVVDLVDQSKHWRAQTLEVKKTPLPFFKCPSQDTLEWTDELVSATSPPWGTDSPLRCHYFAIYGAKPTESGRGGSMDNLDYPENTYTIDYWSIDPTDEGGRATNGVLYFESDVGFRKIIDGTSKTMMYGESSWDAGMNMTWLAGEDSFNEENLWIFNGKQIYHPINSVAYPRMWEEQGDSTVPFHDASLGSKHPGGCHVLMCDGSTHFVSEEIELATLKAMASRASGEVYASPF
jgi:prepilin-type processing-associated H-X9-DG protein